MQTHVTECAAACLGSVLGYFGRWVPLSQLRIKCEVSRDGSTAAGIVRAAKHYGLKCTGWQGDISQLKTLPLPFILFWEYNHFLILEGFDEKWFYLNDPALGRRKLSTEEFLRGYSGVALYFRVDSTFKRGSRRFNILHRLPFWLQDVQGTLICLTLCGLLLALFALVIPVLLTLFVDRVLVDQLPWGGAVAGVMVGTAFLIYSLTWLKQRWLQRLAVKISVVVANRSLSRLLRLPLNYFNHRMAGELIVRVLFIDKIASGLSQHFIGLFIEIVMSAMFLGVMLVYEPTLAVIIFGSCPVKRRIGTVDDADAGG